MSDSIRYPGAGNMISTEAASLADALRGLPVAAPQTSAWPALAAQLAAPGAAQNGRGTATLRTRRTLPAALAASLLLACAATFLAMHSIHRVQPPRATNPVTAASSVHNATNDTDAVKPEKLPLENLAALQLRSHALERWLRETGAESAPQSGQDLAASAEIEDMIGLVDAQLSASETSNDNTALTLWHRRVSLLEDLSMLRYGANVMRFRGGLAAAGMMANADTASRVTWSN